METLEKIDKSLTVCKISTTVQDISEKVFSSCDSLESIECDSDYFKSIDGVLFTADYKTLVRYPPKKNGTDYVVPNSVVNIGSYAFRNCEFLEHIILPDSLINIGESAFSRCKSLQDIILPDSITKICRDTFMLCQSLKKIKLPNSLTEIGNSAFMYCKALQEIDLPNTLSEIGSCIFSNCSSLRRINISVSLNYIPKYAFANCSKLKRITLPNSIKHIESGAFHCCWDLKGIECDSPFFKSINGVLFTADLKTLVCYPQGKGCDNYVVPDSVTNIAEDAFCSFVSPWTADSCKRITLPKSINEITDTTFEHHKSLKWIECDNEHYKSIDGVLFTADCKTLVYYPRGREDSQYIIPDTVTKIENRAFASNSYLRKIIIPKGRMEDFIEMFPEDNEYELAEA